MTSGSNNFKDFPQNRLTIFRACRPVNSFCTFAISYCTFCVGKHSILGPAGQTLQCVQMKHNRSERLYFLEFKFVFTFFFVKFNCFKFNVFLFKNIEPLM